MNLIYHQASKFINLNGGEQVITYFQNHLFSPMMNNFATSQRLLTLQGVYYTAVGVDILDSSKFTSPLQFDAFDNWLGDDFQFVLDNIIDDFFDDIEADLLSVWSTNKSEQESADASALRSALASA